MFDSRLLFRLRRGREHREYVPGQEVLIMTRTTLEATQAAAELVISPMLSANPAERPEMVAAGGE